MKEKNNLKYNSEALDLIIREHRANSDMSTEILIRLIGDRISENLKYDLRGIKKSSNETDKNTQILIELLNGFFVKQGYTTLPTTEDLKCRAIGTTTEFVERRIASQRVKKLDREF